MDVPIRRADDSRPEREFEQLRNAFADQLERWPDFFRALPGALRDVMPLADLEESDSDYVLEVELPGVRREDIDLEIDRGQVRLAAERRESARGGLLRHSTRATGRFAMAVVLPSPVDGDAVRASLEHGVLTVVVPKAERARRRRISIVRRD